MAIKRNPPSVPCDSVFVMSWDTQFKCWIIAKVLPVWHEKNPMQDLYHVRKTDIRSLRQMKKMSFSDVFDKLIFCVQNENDEMYVLAPWEYNKDDIAFVITDGEPPVTSSPSA
jgi:predicted CopG family antitoxin